MFAGMKGTQFALVHVDRADDDDDADDEQLERHHDVVDACRFPGAEHQQAGEQQNDQGGRQIEDARRRCSIGEFHHLAGRLHPLRREMNAETAEQTDRVAGPADSHGRGAHAIFEDQIPADDPGEDLADGRVGIGVGASRSGDHGGQFGVAEADEGACDAGQDKRQDDRGPRVTGRRLAGQHEDAGADDAADAQADERERAERLGETPPRPSPLAAMAASDIRPVYCPMNTASVSFATSVVDDAGGEVHRGSAMPQHVPAALVRSICHGHIDLDQSRPDIRCR